jgi:hypothetical protein
MKKISTPVLLGLFMLAGCACSRDLVPDNVLEGLHKPVVTSVNPAAIQFNGAGFFLNVALNAEDDRYVLYLNDRKVGQAEPGYWRNSVGYMIPKELIRELLSSSSDGATLHVRVTGISENYDISGKFDLYPNCVSEPVDLEIKIGESYFGTARELFPQWSHSREPVIRCDRFGNIHLAWLEKLNGVYQAFFSFSRDAGTIWNQVLNISRSNDSVDQVDLAVDGNGHFYMTWMVGNNDQSDVYFSRSLDEGYNWHFPVRMNAAGEYAKMPSIDVNEHGDVFLAWHLWNDKENPVIRLAVSGDLGNTWNTRSFAAPRASEFWGKPIVAARAGGLVYLFNGRYGGQSQFLDLFSSRDYGRSWEVQEKATGDVYPFQKFSLVRFGAGNQVYSTWGKNLTGGHTMSYWNFFLNRDGAGNWGQVQELQRLCPTVDEKTALSVSGNYVHVVMTQAGGLFLLLSKDEGRTWSLPEFIAGADGLNSSMSPDMVFHPSGKTLLAFVKKTTVMDGHLYLTNLETF